MSNVNSTISTVSTISANSVWRALAQATPRALVDIFTEHAETMATSYTSVKQLANALDRVQTQYGLKPVFRVMRKACDDKTNSTPADIFATGLEYLLTPKNKKPVNEMTQAQKLALAFEKLETADRLAFLEIIGVAGLATIPDSVATPAPAPALV